MLLHTSLGGRELLAGAVLLEATRGSLLMTGTILERIQGTEPENPCLELTPCHPESEAWTPGSAKGARENLVPPSWGSSREGFHFHLASGDLTSSCCGGPQGHMHPLNSMWEGGHEH